MAKKLREKWTNEGVMKLHTKKKKQTNKKHRRSRKMILSSKVVILSPDWKKDNHINKIFWKLAFIIIKENWLSLL